MDDVLQTGFQDISLLTEHTNSEADKKGDKKDKKPRSGSAVVKADTKKASTGTTGELGKLTFTICLKSRDI